MANIFGRQVILPLTNKSGGGVIAGDVVVIDTSNDDAFTTTTSAGATSMVGVAQETIASNASGRVLIAGDAALVNVNASVTRGHYGKTHTVAKQATSAGASRVAGAFCQFKTGGTTPKAVLFGFPDGSTGSAGSPSTPALTLSTTNSTGSAVTLIATDATIAAFDATSPTTQAFADAAATGSAGVAARRDHKHAMPANPRVKVAFVQRNANAAAGNDYAVGNAAWAVIDATNITVTLAAATGDIVGVTVNGQWDGNDYSWLTAASIVSGSPVNYIDNGTGTPGTTGVIGWMDQGDSDQPGGSQNISGEFLYTLQAGDISGGNVTLQLYGKENTGTVKKILARTGYPLQFIVKNYGH